MKKITTVIFCSCLLILVGCQSIQVAKDDSSNKANNASQAVYMIELRSSQKLYSNSVQLQKSFTALCQDVDSHDNLERARLSWHQTMLSWMALQGQQIGPDQALEQSWKVQFWPDKKNTTGRKITELLKQHRTWTQADIADQSVAAQGLGAMEWILFDSASTITSDEPLCQLGQAISQNLASKTKLIEQAWLDNPWRQLDDKAWLADYVSLLSHQLDYTIKKLSLPVAKVGHPKPYFSESWRSQTSMQNIKANVEAMDKLYRAGLEQRLRANGDSRLADGIASQFSSTIELWPESPSLFQLLKSQKGYQTVLSQLNKLEQLRYLIQDEAAVKLGITIGFNATDGD